MAGEDLRNLCIGEILICLEPKDRAILRWKLIDGPCDPLAFFLSLDDFLWKGILIFDASGQYAQIIVHPGVPKFKTNNRLKGTPEENMAAVHGTTATFGTWTIDEASKTITTRYVGGMFPNQAGTEGKRMVVSVSADELKMTNPTTAAGMRSDNVWKRAK